MDPKMFSTLPMTKLFFRCAVPSMISMAITSLYVIADGIFVGKFVGADALAAINLVMPIIMICFALADMMAVGSSVQISIRLGEGKEEEACSIFSFSSLLIVAISCVAAVAGYFFAEPVMALMGADETVARLAVEYMLVYAVFSPAIMIFFALDNYLRICGRAIYSMGMNVFLSVANIILDWIFIVELDMGVAAAALASCISLAAGTLIGLLPFFTGKLALRFVRTRISGQVLKNIIANGSSEFFSNISASVFMVIMNTVLLRLSGSLAVAAFSVVMYIDSFVSSMLFGMVDSLQPAISYNYGAGERGRMFGLEKRILLAGAVLCVSVMFLMISGSGVIIPFFMEGDQPRLLEMATRAMYLFSFSYLVSWVGTTASSFFTALNRPVLSLSVSFSQTLMFPLLAISVLPAFLGLDGVWLSSLLAEALTALLACVFMVRTWRRIRA